MEPVKCVFVPMVFAELYKALGEEERYTETLEDVLGSIYLPLGWLTEAVDAYERRWSSDLEYLTPDSLPDYALPEQHSQFATWILANLHAQGACADLSTKLGTAVIGRALGEVDGVAMPLPPVCSPTIIGWTLGGIVGSPGADLPAVPALRPSEENARMAFDGLVEHMLVLQAMSEPWPEMMQTAMYWRGYGLAEALRPEAASGGEALDLLHRETHFSGAGARDHAIGRHLGTFRQRRNALSHVADSHGRPRFVDAVEAACASSDVDLTMRAMTKFVFHEVARQVRECRPRMIRPGAWDVMVERDLRIWD